MGMIKFACFPLSWMGEVINVLIAHPDPTWRTQALTKLALCLEYKVSLLGEQHLSVIDTLCEQLTDTGVPLSMEQAYATLYILTPYLALERKGELIPRVLQAMTRVVDATACLPTEQADALGNWIRSNSAGNQTALELAERVLRGSGAVNKACDAPQSATLGDLSDIQAQAATAADRMRDPSPRFHR